MWGVEAALAATRRVCSQRLVVPCVLCSDCDALHSPSPAPCARASLTPSPQTHYPEDLEGQRRATDRSFFVPYTYRRARPADPRSLTAFQRLLTLSQLSACAEPARVLFIHLEDLVDCVDDRTLQSLGAMVSTCKALQTAVIRRCGLVSVRSRLCSGGNTVAHGVGTTDLWRDTVPVISTISCFVVHNVTPVM